MIAIYAEKPDVAYKIATAFGGIKIGSTSVNISNYEKYKSSISRKFSKQGYIPVTYDGNTYHITWGVGHMCELKQAKDYNPTYKNWSKMPLPFFPDKYEIKVKEGYSLKQKGRKVKEDPRLKSQLMVVKKVFQSADYIINATDDDREGELIFAYVYEYIKSSKPYKRVFLDSYTESGIKNAFKKLKDMKDVKPVEMAGRARSQADWLVGANMTVAMTLKFGERKQVLSLGRVQTPTLNLLVEREKEIRNFVPETTFYLDGTFDPHKSGKDVFTYTGRQKFDEFKDKNHAVSLANTLKGKTGTVSLYDAKLQKRKAPLLYNLSALSMDANKIYSMTAADTLAVAQKLYTDGYLTYPRTSSPYLPDDMKDAVNEILDLLGKTPEFKEHVNKVAKSKRQMTSRHFNSKKVESHYAIIPTNQIPDFKKLNKQEANIYRLVALSVIRSVFPDATVQNVRIETDVDGNTFTSSGTSVIDEQWMGVDALPKNENILPILKKGDTVDASFEIKEKTTKPPARYNDNTLLAAMKAAGKQIEDKELRDFLSLEGDGGIGTEATRAGIIESVIARYAKRQGKSIVPTDLGIRVIELLPIDDLKSAQLTAEWEERLNRIQNGKDTLDAFINDLEAQTTKWAKEVLNTMNQEQTGNANMRQETGLICPNCGGNIIETNLGFFCSNNERDNPSSCQFRIFKSGKYPFSPDMSKEDVASIISGGKSGVKETTSKKGNTYKYYNVLSADKQSVEKEFYNEPRSAGQETSFKCNICSKNLVKNTQYQFISCPDRHVLINAEYGGYRVTKQDILDLLDGKRIGPKEMVSKAGKTYSAYLYIGDDGKVQRAFD